MQTSPDAAAVELLTSDPRESGELDADVWPGFRGHNAQGIAPAGSPPIHFSGDEGWRWKTPLEGEGHSSPVVWGDAVLLTAALHEADPPTLVIQCFDRRDGSLRWQSVLGQGQGRLHVKNSYASATVATDGQRIFAFFGTAGLFCCDFEGNRVWRADLGVLDHKYGTAASPVLYEDLVIQLCDSAESSYIAAFDTLNGEEVWRTPRPSQGCWSTPVFVEAKLDGGSTRVEMVVNGTEAPSEEKRFIIAYDPASGTELWRVRGTTQFVTPTPLVGSDLVFCASGRNGPIFAIRPGGSGDVTDDPTRIMWRTRRGGPYIPSGLAYRNRVFILRDDGTVDCYNAGNGERIWHERLRGPFSASLMAADGRIYALSERGKVYIFSAAAFELLATNDLDEDGQCLATPAIAGGEIFLRTPSYLYCFSGE